MGPSSLSIRCSHLTQATTALLVFSGNSVTCSDVDCNDMSCPERRTGHTAVLDPDNKMLYMYGGSKGKRWFSDVHALDLTAWTWQKLEVRE